MNDNAVATGSVRAVLSGLPQRLVQDGLVEETAMLAALAGARERKTHLVSWLVSHEMAAARDIAIAAARAVFGCAVPGDLRRALGPAPGA